MIRVTRRLGEMGVRQGGYRLISLSLFLFAHCLWEVKEPRPSCLPCLTITGVSCPFPALRRSENEIRRYCGCCSRRARSDRVGRRMESPMSIACPSGGARSRVSSACRIVAGKSVSARSEATVPYFMKSRTPCPTSDSLRRSLIHRCHSVGAGPTS